MSRIITGDNSLIELGRFISVKDYSSIFILTDSNIILCLPYLLNAIPVLKAAPVITIEAGEKSKSFFSIEKIISELLLNNADRRSLLINLGGGMITDLGGFAASIYKRGIRFINVPTSLMGMTDASIGGKTGINFSGIKNSVGTFNLAEGVFINPIFLQTLPQREYVSATSEIIKHILLSDPDRWSQLVSDPANYFSPQKISALIDHSVDFKQSVISTDFRETGRRHILNLGHTIGHAIESYYLEKGYPLLHGEAIAAGLIAELFLSSKIHGLNDKILNDAVNLILFLFPELNVTSQPDNLIAFLLSDKKNIDSSIGFSLLKSVGNPSPVTFPEIDIILESIEFMSNAFVKKAQALNDNN